MKAALACLVLSLAAAVAPAQGTVNFLNGPGTLVTTNCGVVSAVMVNDTNRDLSGLDPSKNSESECSFVLPDSSTIVAAFWNTHLSEYALGVYGYAFPGINSPRSVSWARSG